MPTVTRNRLAVLPLLLSPQLSALATMLPRPGGKQPERGRMLRMPPTPTTRRPVLPKPPQTKRLEQAPLPRTRPPLKSLPYLKPRLLVRSPRVSPLYKVRNPHGRTPKRPKTKLPLRPRPRLKSLQETESTLVSPVMPVHPLNSKPNPQRWHELAAELVQDLPDLPRNPGATHPRKRQPPLPPVPAPILAAHKEIRSFSKLVP